MAHIRVLSLDYDGCLSHKGTVPEAALKGHYDYFEDPKYERGDIVGGNRELVKYLRDSSKHFDATKVFIGSNRQSCAMDRENGINGSASCFSKIKEFALDIGATFDPLLMADIYSDQAPGSAIHAAQSLQDAGDRYRQGVNINAQPEWLADDKKLSVLMAQMHKVAAENSKDTITFEFFDDRSDILDSLKNYFEKYPTLIPSNVTLKLNRYDGPKTDESPLITEVATIAGTGGRRNYRTLIWDMAAVCLPKIFMTLGSDIAAQRVTSISQILEFQNINNPNISKAINIEGKLDMMDHYTPDSIPVERLKRAPAFFADPQVQFALDTLNEQIKELESESFLSSIIKDSPLIKIDALKFLCAQIMEKGDTDSVSQILRDALANDNKYKDTTKSDSTNIFKASVQAVISQHRSKVFGIGDSSTKKIVDTLLQDLDQGKVARSDTNSSMQFH